MLKKVFLAITFLSVCGLSSSQILEKYVTAGKQLLYIGEVNCAFESFSRGVKYNNIDASYYLGLCFANGYGTTANPQVAFNHFRRAAEGGSDRAKAATSEMLIHGIGTAKNTNKAKYWIDKLLMNRNHEGYFLKGMCLLEGEIFQQNILEALENLQKAIDAGNPDACVYLAKQYFSGKFIDVDIQKAYDLITRACTLEPKNILLQDIKGELLMNTGNIASAESLWQQLINISPSYAIEFNSPFANAMRSKNGIPTVTKSKYESTRTLTMSMINDEVNDNASAISQPTTTAIISSTTTAQPLVVIQQPVFEQSNFSTKILNSNSAKEESKENVPKKLKADVDENIPSLAISNEKKFAIIIANEHYQDVSQVPYANHDGEVFSVYCNKALGFPSSNVHFVKDATLNNIKRELNWIKKVAAIYGNEATLIFYYAGHGIPDEKTQNAYLLPVDGYGTDVTTGYSLKELYKNLGELSFQKIVVLIDACFSGTQRGEGMLASARGIAIKAKQETVAGKMVVLSAAQGDETAYPYEEQGHGLFTYFLLKKLQETKGYVSLGELSDYISGNVLKKSIVINGKSQTPSVAVSTALNDNWKNWKLNE